MPSKYHSLRRAEVAAATRATIMDRARDLIVARGYGTVTVADIATAARIAVPTVYTSAGSKADILRELLTPAMHDPSIEQTFSAIAATDDPHVIIDATATSVRRTHEHHWDILYALLPHTPAEPSAAAVLAASQSGFVAAFTTVIDRLTEVHALPADMDHGYAVDMLRFHFGHQSWFALVGEFGWTFDKAQDWLADSVKHALHLPRKRSRRRVN